MHFPQKPLAIDVDETDHPESPRSHLCAVADALMQKPQAMQSRSPAER